MSITNASRAAKVFFKFISTSSYILIMGFLGEKSPVPAPVSLDFFQNDPL